MASTNPFTTLDRSHLGHVLTSLQAHLVNILKNFDSGDDPAPLPVEDQKIKDQISAFISAITSFKTNISKFDSGRAPYAYEFVPIGLSIRAFRDQFQSFYKDGIHHPAGFDVCVELFCLLENMPDNLQDVVDFMDPQVLSGAIVGRHTPQPGGNTFFYTKNDKVNDFGNRYKAYKRSAKQQLKQNLIQFLNLDEDFKQHFNGRSDYYNKLFKQKNDKLMNENRRVMEENYNAKSPSDRVNSYISLLNAIERMKNTDFSDVPDSFTGFDPYDRKELIISNDGRRLRENHAEFLRGYIERSEETLAKIKLDVEEKKQNNYTVFREQIEKTLNDRVDAESSMPQLSVLESELRLVQIKKRELETIYKQIKENYDSDIATYSNLPAQIQADILSALQSEYGSLCLRIDDGLQSLLVAEKELNNRIMTAQALQSLNADALSSILAAKKEENSLFSGQITEHQATIYSIQSLISVQIDSLRQMFAGIGYAIPNQDEERLIDILILAKNELLDQHNLPEQINQDEAIIQLDYKIKALASILNESESSPQLDKKMTSLIQLKSLIENGNLFQSVSLLIDYKEQGTACLQQLRQLELSLPQNKADISWLESNIAIIQKIVELTKALEPAVLTANSVDSVINQLSALNNHFAQLAEQSSAAPRQAQTDSIRQNIDRLKAVFNEKIKSAIALFRKEVNDNKFSLSELIHLTNYFANIKKPEDIKSIEELFQSGIQKLIQRNITILKDLNARVGLNDSISNCKNLEDRFGIVSSFRTQLISNAGQTKFCKINSDQFNTMLKPLDDLLEQKQDEIQSLKDRIKSRGDLVTNITEALQNYTFNRLGKSVAEGKDKRTIFIGELITLLDSYRDTGDNVNIIAKIESALDGKQFPGRRFTPLLNRIVCQLRDQSVEYPEARNMVTFKYNRDVNQALRDVQDRITRMKTWDKDSTEKGVITQLADDLQNQFNRYIQNNPSTTDLKRTFVPFKKEFMQRLHSQDDKMMNHRGWKRVCANFIAAVTVVGMALKVISSKILDGHVIFFADKTKRLQNVDKVEHSLMRLEDALDDLADKGEVSELTCPPVKK